MGCEHDDHHSKDGDTCAAYIRNRRSLTLNDPKPQDRDGHVDAPVRRVGSTGRSGVERQQPGNAEPNSRRSLVLQPLG
jgi:hypothetical protein